MNSSEVKKFFVTLASLNPVPKGELEFTNPFTCLVAVVLSAQATDKGVNKATRELFKVADTPQKMMALGEDELKHHIKSIGFFNTKAKNIIALSAQLLDQFNGDIPSSFEELVQLPGVGRKTANVVLNQVFHQPTIAVDTHVFRVSNRTGLAPGKTPVEVEEKLLATVPREYRLHAHHWLILHGRYICKAQKPLCEICPVQQYCKFYQQKSSAFSSSVLK